MGIIIRQGARSTLIQYVGVLIGAFNLLWLFPKFMSPAEIGLMRLLQDIAFSFASFAQLGGSNIVDKFYPVFRDDSSHHNGFFFWAVVYPVPGFLLFSLVFLIFRPFWLSIYAENTPAINEYYLLIAPLTFLYIYQFILEAYCRTQLKIVIPAVWREVVLRVLTAGLVLLYFVGWLSFAGVMKGVVAVVAIHIFLLLMYLYRLNVLRFAPNLNFITPQLLRQIGTFGSYILIGGIGGVIVTKIDSLMIAEAIDADSVAIYSIAFYIGTIIEMPRRAISQISTPILSRAWAENDLALIEELYKKSALNQTIVGVLFFLGIWCNVDAIFNLIPNAEIYRAGKYVILFVGLGKLVDMISGVNSEIILQSQYYRFNLLSIVVLAVVTIITNLIFIPRYGITGAAFATALSVTLYNLAKYGFLYLKFRLQPLDWRIALICTLGLVIYGLVELIPAPQAELWSSIQNILVRSGIIVVLFGGTVYGLGLSEDLNRLLNKYTGFRRS
ncbi:Membrane protein involved in the export of O-antigen and teichoic acid [Catalinimonas alkaloidigena]|uniref:Membrane protein involved in the export of O-antigen and teichoic acid n=1 Tax=Catalinimonas alkaloidigena TaxID=1075417 RepID=A0A1G8ZKC1_9BACT|nr:oligosaccharide flippase family protein [Catalinimonas alkaloidigena]SDK15572.1 Membrane protein involved in the export of O-antigen and teichoic acid [Catalinimonas alkaloidigena]